MFRHILVPTDLTEKSMHALSIAVKMASIHEYESRVTLLHVIETIQDTDCEQFEEFYKKLGRRAHKKMDLMMSVYRDERLSISKEITYGRRVGEIIRYAHDHQIELIVLSSHKISIEDTTRGWGSISYKVGILSPCPVMLVK